MSQRRGGVIRFSIDGVRYQAKGSFSYGLGTPAREGISGHEGFHGFIERPQTPFIEGEITDSESLSVKPFLNITNGQIALALANGKGISLSSAYYAGEAVVNTEEGSIGVRFEGRYAEEV